MNQWELLIVGLAAIYMAGLSFERIQAIKDRKKLKHVIYVNGTRGKSTVTRLIAAGLRHQGMRVVCKTTGTVPVVFHADGKEELIRRNGPANIREQLSILHLAAKEKADVLVLSSPDKWYGVTYAADKPVVVAALAEKTKEGLYPDGLWK